jgi:Fic family protein
MNLKILTLTLFDDFKNAVKESPLVVLERMKRTDISVDYFDFYKSVSSVYSSKIEGVDIDFDSFYKHKFLNVKFKPDYTRKADDLFSAYDFIEKNPLNLETLKHAHRILSANLLPKTQQGKIRTNPMFVVNNDDKIEYVAANHFIINQELVKLFSDIETLLSSDFNPVEIFYFASFIHLVFVKIHPFQDGNGRTARLLEKWFLLQKLGETATAIQLEKNYFKNSLDYYSNLRKLGLEYENLDYSKSLDFLLMTIQGLDK